MNIIEMEAEIKNGGVLDIIDTRESVEEPFSKVEFKNIISLFILGSTGVVTMRHDGNGHSIIGPSITLLLKIGKMRFDTWQQLIFLEPDVARNQPLL
ncbi:MAG: hypothetical protein QXR44_03815 [Thermoproteota archaeon]